MGAPTLTKKPEVRVANPWHAHNTSSHVPNAELQRVMDDIERGIGIVGPFATAEEAMASMLKGMAELDDEEEDFCTP